MADESKMALELVEAKNESQIGGLLRKYNNELSERQKQYYEIDVKDAMTKLSHCGSLLQLAYACSDGYQCQGNIAVLLSQYGTLVKDSFITATRFMSASLTALKYHKLSLKLATKNTQKAVTIICKCSKLAETMAVAAGDVCEKAQTLENKAVDALECAIGDKTVTKEKRQEVRLRIETAKTQQEQLSKLTQKLRADLDEAREAEANAVKAADSQRSREFTLGVIKAITAPICQLATMAKAGIGGVLANQGAQAVADMAQNMAQKKADANSDEKSSSDESAAGKSLDDRAWLLTKQRIDIKNKLIEQNANLAQTLSELSGLQEHGDSLSKSLKALELAIKTLGKIKVIFSNTRKYWEGVKANCLQIVDDNELVQELTDDGLEEELTEAITSSALNWFVLCKVNFDAKQAISAVDRGIDAILNDLPSESEALRLVPQLSIEMRQVLADEQRAIEAAHADEEDSDE